MTLPPPEALLMLPIRKILRLYRTGALSPVEMARAALTRAQCVNAELNALCFMDEKDTLAQARESEKRWRRGTPRKLDGITTTIKDWYDISGWPTRTGSHTTSAARKKEDSTQIAALRAAGCIFIGKTTLPEFGHKGVTDSPLFGITRNPWDRTKTCGGSSGGAAVCAATGVATLNLGSDAGGSIRIPAAFCGVFGFKPTPGLIPSWPPTLFSDMSSVGPLTRHVADAAAMTRALSGKTLSIPRNKALRIGWAPKINNTRMMPPVANVLTSCIQKLSRTFDITTLPLKAPDVVSVFNTHWMAVASLMATQISPAQKKKMDKRFLHWVQRGDQLHLHDYMRARHARLMLTASFEKIFDNYDILLTPTTAMTAFAAGTNMPPDKNGNPWDDWTPFTYPANLAQLPAASLPAGFSADGLPVGLQIMARRGNDALVLHVAQMLETALTNLSEKA